MILSAVQLPEMCRWKAFRSISKKEMAGFHTNRCHPSNRLEAEGKEVTALTMLSALGRGSLTTIYKHLDAWRETKPVKSPTDGKDGVAAASVRKTTISPK